MSAGQGVFDVIERYKLACRVDSVLRQADGETKLKRIAVDEGYAPSTLRGERHVPRLLTEEELRHELRRYRADGQPLGWSHFVALSPLAGMPREQGKRLALELLDRARQGNLPSRWVREQARGAVRQHKDRSAASLVGRDERPDHDGHLLARVGELERKIADLQGEVRRLALGSALHGRARTPLDNGQATTLAGGPADGHGLLEAKERQEAARS